MENPRWENAEPAQRETAAMTRQQRLAGLEHARRAAFAAFVFTITWAGIAAPAARADSPSPKSILFDSDFGSGADEAFALALILGSPELELRGMTTVSGDAEVRALMACRFLTMTGRRHIPVAAGSAPQPARDIGASYQYYYHPSVLFHRTSRPQEEHAARWLHSRLAAEPGALTILASGPLTNIARLLREHPETRDHLQRIVWVGGALRTEGFPDEPLPDEANLALDPAAAQNILTSGIPLLIVPAEAAAALTLDQDGLEEVFRPGSTFTNQVRALHQLEGGGTVALGAAFAAALCFDESLAELEEMCCEVDPGGFLRKGSGPPNAHVVVRAKRGEFAEFYVRRLASLLPPFHRPVRPLDAGSMPSRVHVSEDYETDIERRWWMCGVPETDDVPPHSTRACRGVLTHDFDDLLGDSPSMHTAVIFNPVPGPPVGPNTRLSFRYRLTGSDRLRVQIYSLTNGYHRHLVLEGLSQARWDSATVDLTHARRADGTGGPLSEDERIDDIQFYASPEADLLIDDILLYEAAAPEETRPFPMRVLFTGWFDTGEQGQEWPGAFDIVPLSPPGKWKAARSLPGPDGASPWLRVNLRGERRLSPSTQLRFRYRLTGAQSLRVQLVDGEGNLSAAADLEDLQEDAWMETTLDWIAPDAAPEERGPREGDRVEEIRFLLPDTAAELLIDDLLLYDPGR
ncbi:MAG TPA: nucleoside hydrolase [Verrucomicrobiales bacterium]|nr:nucleoside hydrolase [Verrucomicrobiales bacterium]